MPDVHTDILLIDKPKGITSFDCIRILRKKLGVRKMGHAGTLDPMATGLMIIGVGEGTKKLQEFLKLPKVYEAEILLGISTDTGDVTGKVLKELGIMKYELWKEKEEEIKEVLKGMVGKMELPVPAYSAIKRGGESLYKKARRGEVVETPVKTMSVTSVEFLGLKILPFLKGVPARGRDLKSSAFVDLGTSPPANWRAGFRKGGINLPVVSVRFHVSSGTYIRSLAEELGRRLHVPATLAGLRRTSIGEFKVEDAEKI